MEEEEASGQSSAGIPSGTHSSDLKELLVDICKAALMEIIAKAEDSGLWNFPIPASESLDIFLPRFRTPPQPGRRIEYSIEKRILPFRARELIYYMTNIDQWASLLSHIVHRASSIPQKANSSEFKDLQLVSAEVLLPTPFLRIRKLRFLRFKKEIEPNMCAIVDVGEDYLYLTPQDTISESRCRRRPSGVIIRDLNQEAEVIWIENMEVREWQPLRPEHNIYSEVMGSNRALGARRWIEALCWSLEQHNCTFTNVKMQLNENADSGFLSLPYCIKKLYWDCVIESPDHRLWKTIQAENISVLKCIAMEHAPKFRMTKIEAAFTSFRIPMDHVPKLYVLKTYTTITSFRIQVKPLVLLQYLVQKNLLLQWPDFEGIEEVARYVNDKGNYCITVHKKPGLIQQGYKQPSEYLLQETSNDGFCAFVVSAKMSYLDLDHTALAAEPTLHFFPLPSGFAIIPDGPAGLESDASLVSIVLQQRRDSEDISTVIDRIRTIIAEIQEEVQQLE